MAKASLPAIAVEAPALMAVKWNSKLALPSSAPKSTTAGALSAPSDEATMAAAAGSPVPPPPGGVESSVISSVAFNPPISAGMPSLNEPLLM